jgi:tetratricopeptide (TPR) repeat protein
VCEALADSLAGQPAVQARIWSVLGTMYLARGQMPQAEALLRRAYDRLLIIDGSDSLDVAQTYHELARAVEGRDGRRTALPMFAASVERLRRAGADASDLRIAEREFAERSDDLRLQQQTLERLVAEAGIHSKLDSMGRAATLNALAISRLSVGNTREAIALFDETLQLLTAMLPPEHPNRLVVAGNLSSALRDFGDYPDAERLARDVLEKRRAEVTRNGSAIASAEERVALIRASRGFLEESEQGLRSSLRLQRATPTPSSLSIARTRLGLGVVVALRGRLSEGLAQLDSAELGFQRDGGVKDALFVTLYRAFLHSSSGEAEAAAALVRRVEKPYRAAYADEPPKLAMLDDMLGMTALAEARPETALAHFSEAAERRRSRLPPLHPEIAGSACGRAVALVQLERVAEARPALRDACSRYARYGLHSRALVQWAETLLSERR